MKLHQLSKLKTKGAKRLGRGPGSGKGKTAGRGTKGQKSRSGYNLPRRFEGGQMPWIQRLPKKKGFRSRYPKAQIVKLSVIENKYKAGEKVEPRSLMGKGLIKNRSLPTKILADKKPEKTFKFRGVRLSGKILNFQPKSTLSSTVSKKVRRPRVANVKRSAQIASSKL